MIYPQSENKNSIMEKKKQFRLESVSCIDMQQNQINSWTNQFFCVSENVFMETLRLKPIFRNQREARFDTTLSPGIHLKKGKNPP